MAVTGSTNVDIFRDLVTVTSSTTFTGPEQIINDATQHQNYFTRFELSGGDRGSVIQAGPNIIDQIILDVPQVAQFYDPNAATFAYQRSDVLSSWSIPWRFLFTHYTFTNHEIILNTGGLTGGKLKEKLKDIRKVKETACITDLVDTLEATAWAPPSGAQMEDVAGKQPHSILCFVSELSSGLPPGYAASGHSTVMGINPASKTSWKNQVSTYTDLPKVGTDLFSALSRGVRSAMWSQLPYQPQLSQQSTTNGFTFYTDTLGMDRYEESLRINQDEFKNGSNGQDPHYGAPTFRGIPFVYISSMDGAALWPTGTAGALSTSTDTTNSNAGSRYVGLTRDHIKCVWNSAVYMQAMPEIIPENQPHVHVMPKDTWMNRVCRSRRRHLVVAPSANLS